MTTFSGPLHVKTHDTDTTVASIEGTGAASFRGVVKSGPAANTEGHLLLSQAATVVGNTSGASSIRLPAAAQIADWWLVVHSSASANSQGLNVRIGTSGDATYFGTLKASAKNIYRAGIAPNATSVSAANSKIGATAVQLHVDVTAATSVADTIDFEAVLFVTYVRGS